jgi:hypothetical protein
LTFSLSDVNIFLLANKELQFINIFHFQKSDLFPYDLEQINLLFCNLELEVEGKLNFLA